MGRIKTQSYTPPEKVLALGPPPETPPPVDGQDWWPVILPVTAVFQGERKGTKVVVAIMGKTEDDRYEQAQAWLERDGLCRPLSTRIDGYKAEQIARAVLAGKRETIEHFQTLNALATFVLWAMRGDEWFQCLNVSEPLSPEQKIAAEAEANRRRLEEKRRAEIARDAQEALL